MYKKQDTTLTLAKVLLKLKAKKEGAKKLSASKVVYTSAEVTAAKLVLNRLIEAPFKSEVISIREVSREVQEP